MIGCEQGTKFGLVNTGTAGLGAGYREGRELRLGERDVSRGRVTFQHSQHWGTGGGWVALPSAVVTVTTWHSGPISSSGRQSVQRYRGSLALLDTGHDLLPTNRGVQNKCSNICLGSGLFWNLCFLLIIQKQKKPILVHPCPVRNIFPKLNI